MFGLGLTVKRGSASAQTIHASGVCFLAVQLAHFHQLFDCVRTHRGVAAILYLTARFGLWGAVEGSSVRACSDMPLQISKMPISIKNIITKPIRTRASMTLSFGLAYFNPIITPMGATTAKAKSIRVIPAAISPVAPGDFVFVWGGPLFSVPSLEWL